MDTIIQQASTLFTLYITDVVKTENHALGNTIVTTISMIVIGSIKYLFSNWRRIYNMIIYWLYDMEQYPHEMWRAPYSYPFIITQEDLKKLRAVKVMFNNTDYTSEFRGNNPMNITKLSDIAKQAYTYNTNDYWYFQEYLTKFILYIIANTSIRTRWDSSSNLIPNQTLFWTDISKFKIMDSRIKERLIHEKTLTSLEEKLPRDITREIGKFVGSKEYVKKGGKKSRKYRKNKLKRFRKNKTKNRWKN